MPARSAVASAAGDLRRGLQQNWLAAVKAGAAASVAWLVARWLIPSGSDFYAPLVAVLSVQPTVVRTLRDTAQRLVGVAIGLALGYLVVVTVGLHTWSLAAVLAVATLVSAWRRLDAQGTQVPIAALLVLLFAESPTGYAVQLLGEGAIGALTAAAINLLVVPPLYVLSAESHLAQLRTELGDIVDAMSRSLGEQWPPESPDWLSRARGVSEQMHRARDAVERGSESTVLNPRGRPYRERPRHQRQTLSTLEHVTVSVRDLAGTLEAAADQGDDGLRLNDGFRPQLAEALHSLATALSSHGASQPTTQEAAEPRPVDQAAEHVRSLQRRLAQLDAAQVPAFLTEAALVTELDLIIRELRPATLEPPPRSEEGYGRRPGLRSRLRWSGSARRMDTPAAAAPAASSAPGELGHQQAGDDDRGQADEHRDEREGELPLVRGQRPVPSEQRRGGGS